jgi:hypothetical protein
MPMPQAPSRPASSDDDADEDRTMAAARPRSLAKELEPDTLRPPAAESDTLRPSAPASDTMRMSAMESAPAQPPSAPLQSAPLPQFAPLPEPVAPQQSVPSQQAAQLVTGAQPLSAPKTSRWLLALIAVLVALVLLLSAILAWVLYTR